MTEDTAKGDGNEGPRNEVVDDLEDSQGGVSGEEGSQGRDHSKKKGPVEDFTFVRVRLPHRKKGEMFAIAEQLMGGSRLKIICEDGKSRLARIPGKMKKRRWIRTGDLLIIKPWDFQDEKADVVRRYTKTESSNLSRRGVIPDSINVF